MEAAAKALRACRRHAAMNIALLSWLLTRSGSLPLRDIRDKMKPIRRAIKYSALCLWVSALSACHGKASNFPPFPESAIWITFTKQTPP